MAPLDQILHQLIEVTPPPDDPTGAKTFAQLEMIRLIRNAADHHFVGGIMTKAKFGILLIAAAMITLIG